QVRRQDAETIDYPTYSSIPQDLSFTCTDRIPGYYADPEAQCQVWHWCLPGGQMYSFLCPNQTMFNQLYRVCDWYYNVDCPGSPDSYSVNEDLYKIPDGNGNAARGIDGNNGAFNDVNNNIDLAVDARNNDIGVVDDVIAAEDNNGFGAIVNAGENTEGNGEAQTAITFDNGNNNPDGSGRSLLDNNEFGSTDYIENYDFGSRISEDNGDFG
ncbi:unnamed protein product, partial [Meganyctiphanes norvegica]